MANEPPMSDSIDPLPEISGISLFPRTITALIDRDEKLLKEAKKLPWEERLAHKNWNVRKDANIDLAAVCDSITDPKDPRIREFGPFFRKTVADSSVQIQEKALEALIAYLKAADADASKYAKEICDAIVAECLKGRPKIVEKAQEAFMLWVELEAVEPFLDGMEDAIKKKVAKAVVPAIDVMFQALSEFGSKIVPPKRILKMLAELFDHQDQNVRASSKRLTLELCRWIGKDVVLSILIDKMGDTMKKELEVELVNVTEAAKPTRKIRSEQDKEPEQEAVSEAVGPGPSKESSADVPQEIDECELVDLVDVLTPVEKSGFHERVKASKWSERKEAVAELTIAPGDVREIYRTLEKVLQRKNEEAAMATKRLKELLESWKASRDLYGAGKSNGPGFQALMQAIEHELEVTVHVHEVRAEYERQMEERARMVKEVAELKEAAQIFEGHLSDVQTMSPGARNSRIFALEAMLSTSSSTLVSMASQLSEAEEHERAFSCRGRWNQVRSLAEAKNVMNFLFNLASSSRCHLKDRDVDCREKDLEIRDLKEKVVKLHKEIELQKAEILHPEKLMKLAAKANCSRSDPLPSTLEEEEEEEARNKQQMTISDPEQSDKDQADDDYIDISDTEQSDEDQADDDTRGRRRWQAKKKNSKANCSRSASSNGENSEPPATCCTCSRWSSCKYSKCKCRAAGRHCGMACYCKPVKCSNRALPSTLEEEEEEEARNKQQMPDRNNP